MKKRTWMTVIACLMAVLMVLGMAACGSKAEEPAAEPEQEQQEEQEEAPEVSDGPELSEEQMDDLWQQAAEKTLTVRYGEYVPDQVFGFGEAFNIARDGDKGTWDVYLVTGEYVVIDGSAYLASGSNGEAILHFDYTSGGPQLTDIEWSEDGGGHDEWIKAHFSEEGYKSWETFLSDEKSVEFLNEVLDKNASDTFGVPVDKDNVLVIDDEKGTYEISKVIESGDPADDTYTFDTEVIKEGKLEDLK